MLCKSGFKANAIQSEFIDMGRRYDMVPVTAETIRASLIGEHHCYVGYLGASTMRIKLIGLTNTK